MHTLIIYEMHLLTHVTARPYAMDALSLHSRVNSRHRCSGFQFSFQPQAAARAACARAAGAAAMSGSHALNDPASPWFWVNNVLYYIAAAYCMLEWLRLVYHDRKLIGVQVRDYCCPWQFVVDVLYLGCHRVPIGCVGLCRGHLGFPLPSNSRPCRKLLC